MNCRPRQRKRFCVSIELFVVLRCRTFHWTNQEITKRESAESCFVLLREEFVLPIRVFAPIKLRWVQYFLVEVAPINSVQEGSRSSILGRICCLLRLLLTHCVCVFLLYHDMKESIYALSSFFLNFTTFLVHVVPPSHLPLLYCSLNCSICLEKIVFLRVSFENDGFSLFPSTMLSSLGKYFLLLCNCICELFWGFSVRKNRIVCKSRKEFLPFPVVSEFQFEFDRQPC